MNKLILSSLFACLFAVAATAQKRTPVIIDTVIKTPTIQCEMCENRIKEYLMRIEGVNLVKVNVTKDKDSRSVRVKFHSNRTNVEMIKASIANLGYQANEIEANPDSYKTLPKCCKKLEDGGGMPKH